MTAAELVAPGCVVAAYLLGAIPFGLLVARVAGGVDVRQAGSGNIGATNVARTVGRRWGILTLILDAAKGAGPVLVARFGLNLSLQWTVAAGLAAVLGHVFPVYLRFHGGKGVATAAGVFLALAPAASMVALGVFAVGYGFTRIVSVGSLLGAAGLTASAILIDGRVEVISLATAVMVVVFVRHTGNIRRLLHREEKPLDSPPRDGMGD